MTDSDRALTRRALQAEHERNLVAMQNASLQMTVAQLLQRDVPGLRADNARIEAELRAMDVPQPAVAPKPARKR